MSDFYRKLPLRLKNERQFSQVFWAPAPCITPSTLALRLGSLKAGTDIRDAQLELVRLDANTFGGHSETERVNIKMKMPMPELGLNLSEELTVVKAKLRPAVLIFRNCTNLRREARFVAKITGKPVEPNRHLFAPVFSLRKDDGTTDYPAEFIQLVQSAKYPHILFLPASSGPIKNDSMLVLSDTFQAGIATVDPTDWCIDPDILGLKLNAWDEFLMHEATTIADLL